MSKTENTDKSGSSGNALFNENRPRVRLLDWIDVGQEDHRLERILIAGRRILDQLGSLHGQRKIHGCLTPDAISVSSSSSEFFLEIAAERKADGLVESKSIEGICYLAPEQTGVVSRLPAPATDLYAVGLLFYRMLTGENPLNAGNLNDLLMRQMTWNPSSLRASGFPIPRSFDELILRLVKRDAADRYQKASAVAKDIESILEWIRHGGSDDELAIGKTDTREKIADPSLVGRSIWISNFLKRLNSDIRISHCPWIIQASKGQGKSRLFNEFACEAACRSIIVLHASGTQGELSQPLEAIKSIIQGLEAACHRLPELETQLRKELDGHIENLQPLMPWLWEGQNSKRSDSGPENFAGRRLRQSLQCLVSTLGMLDHSIVLLIDDLDRCDDLSRGLFLDWVKSQQQRLVGKLKFVASISVEIDSLLTGLDGLLYEVLNPLTKAETIELLQSMSGNFPNDAIALVADAAHGNPSMAISLLYGMLESGTAIPNSSGWKIRSLSMESLQGHRLTGEEPTASISSLPADCRRLLTAAAILGRSCQIEEARTLARLSEPEAQIGIDLAVQRQWVWADSTRTNLGFVHESIRQSFLDNLPKRDRVAFHLRSARMIRRRSSDRCFELAYHFDAAGIAESAFDYAMRAAKLSQQQYANEHAIRYYRMALRWIPVEETQRIAQITEELAEVFLSMCDYEQAESAYVEALETITDQVARMRITGRLGDVAFKRGQMQNAAKYYASALALSGVKVPHSSASMILGLLQQVVRQACHSFFGLRKSRPPAQIVQRLRWNLFSRLAHTYWFSRGPLWTLMAHLRGMNEAEGCEDSAELAKAYSEHGPVCSLLGQFRRAEEYSQRSLDIRIKMNDAWGQGQTLSYCGVVKLAASRFEECFAVSMEAVELLQKAGDAWETNMARYQGANALYRLGRFREAADHAHQIHLSGLEIGDAQAAGISLDILMRTAPGMVNEEVVESQAAIVRTDAQSHAQTQLALALLRLRQERMDEAVQILEDTISRCKKAGHLNTYISPCYVWLATARRMAFLATSPQKFTLWHQRFEQAKRSIIQACRVAKKYRSDLPHAYRERAWLYVLEGHLVQAKKLFSLSLSVAKEIDSPMEEYETLRCLNEISKELGVGLLRIEDSQVTRLRLLSTSLADSISLLDARKTDYDQVSLSLVDRFDKLLVDGRRIAGSLNREAIFTEGLLASQHLLRGQDVFLFESEDFGLHWKIAHHNSSNTALCHVPKLTQYQPFIVETCVSGACKVFATKTNNGLTHGSLIAVPIRIREVIVACLAVEHAEVENLFGQAEMQVAEFIATLMGAALENAEGFANLRDMNTTLEQRVAARTEELREAMAIAVAASQAKSQFLATMSHEVRTPLNGILGMTRLALAKCPDLQQSNYLSTIQRSGESLLYLLNDLLDFSKIEAGKMSVECLPFDPRQMLGDVIGLLAAPAWQKGIEVIASFDPQLPEQIRGDAVRLKQIVSNLVGNAIKFTSSGCIEISAEVVETNDGLAPTWKITVSDTGIGIPKSKQASIFEAFSQADTTTTRRFGGTGLGLSISVELVQLMEGTIEVESEENIGSRFTVTLPLVSCDQQEATLLHSCRLVDYKILVLEPNAAARKNIERLLEGWQATVVTMDRWENLADQAMIDFELFDLAIASGAEAVEFAKAAQRSNLETWIVHAPDSKSIDGFVNLYKPVLPCDLVRHLMEVASKADHSKSLSILTPSTASQSQPTRTAGHLKVLVAEDGEINRMVLVGLLDLLGYSATVVENGLLATELVAQEKFDICLMDLDMPEMDGVEATKVIRSTGNRLTIYAMTAHHDDHHASLCREAGMNGYLTKPIRADQLKTILQSVEMIGKS